MRVGSVEPARAAGQHRSLTQLLQGLGAALETVPFVHGAYDSVFVKDNALLTHCGGQDRALLAQPRFVERRAEQPARARALTHRGFQVEGHAAFEGGDLVVLPHWRGALLGTGFRSEARAASTIARFLETDVHPVELVDPRLYHLDTALTALADGTIAFCPDAFSLASRRYLESAFPKTKLLRVPYADACQFALNTIEIGRHIVLGGHSSWLTARLRERGYMVHVPDLAQFRHAGGSAACLVARVHGSAASVTSSSTAAIRSTAA